MATGSNVSGPAGIPAVPTGVFTQSPNLFAISGGCEQQYDLAIDLATDAALAADGAGLALNAIGAAADVVGLTASEVAASAQAAQFGTMGAAMIAGAAGTLTLVGLGAGVGAAGAVAETMAGSSAAEAVALTAQIAGAGSTVLGVASEAAGLAFAIDAQVLSHYQNTLPSCDQEFTGTVTVSAGGVNVMGGSYFHDNIGVAADVDASGTISGNQVHAAQGISAHGGAIWIGDPNGTSYSNGITLGGGALSGAGTGGAQAITGHLTAIAIGNSAEANDAGGIALGDGAETGTGVSIGQSAGASADAGIAIGRSARAREDSDTAVGNGSTVNAANGTALGAGTSIASLSDNGVVVGQGSSIGLANAVGSDNVTAVGQGIIIGDGIDDAVAIGQGANVIASGGTAIGRGASTTGVNSTAIGFGSVALLDNQQVFGTGNETYTMPGLTSDLSRERQLTRLELPTTDAYGNLSSDGGQLFRAMARAQAGIALGYALDAPQLTQSENYAVSVGYGYNDGDGTAIGFNAIGVLGRGVFSEYDRVAFSVGVGVGRSEFQNYSEQTIAGSGKLQLSW